MRLESGKRHALPRARILVTDVDGTLLDSNGKLTQECVAAANLFRRQGGGIILATGKLYCAIEGLVNLLGLQLPQIVCDGGAVAYPNAGVVAPVATMSSTDVEEICSFLRKHKIEFVLYCPTGIAAEETDVGKGNIAKLSRIGEPEAREVSLTEYVRRGNPVLKILSFVESAVIERDLIALVGDQYPGVRSSRTSPYFLEFSSSDSGKLAALKRVSNICKFNLAEVAAIGDNDNDADMISRVGLGAAVVGASEKAKGAASMLVPSNDENGFAVFVAHILGNWS